MHGNDPLSLWSPAPEAEGFGTGAQARVGASVSASPRRALARPGNPPLGDSEDGPGCKDDSL